MSSLICALYVAQLRQDNKDSGNEILVCFSKQNNLVSLGYEGFPVTQNFMRPFLPPRTLRGLFHKPHRNKNKMACVFIDDLELG
jgi:hypothetical protein